MKAVQDFNERSVVGAEVRKMERCILEAAYTSGAITSELWDIVYTLYADGSERTRKQLEIVLDYLVEQRFLFPYIRQVNSTQTITLPGHAGGITPKGIDRLWELRYPRYTWFKKNFLAVVVAAVAAVGGAAQVASVVVNLIVNMN